MRDHHPMVAPNATSPSPTIHMATGFQWRASVFSWSRYTNGRGGEWSAKRRKSSRWATTHPSGVTSSCLPRSDIVLSRSIPATVALAIKFQPQLHEIVHRHFKKGAIALDVGLAQAFAAGVDQDRPARVAHAAQLG